MREGLLARQLRGDLDWIVMMALNKEPERRYDSANGLAMDLGRYLTFEPVLAGPPSIAYRLRKFGRKYRGQLLAAGLLLIAVTTGGSISTYLAIENAALGTGRSMNVRIITVPLRDGEFDDAELRALSDRHELLACREQFFFAGGVAHLACVVEYRQRVARSAESAVRQQAPRKGEKGEKPDPRASLCESDRELFAAMRQWRAQTAHAEGVPAYVVLTNAELLRVISAKPSSKTALLAVEGIGHKRAERHGEALLAALQKAQAGAAVAGTDQGASR